ncbi:acyl-CoA carboxylase epsilon subunit [Sinomonas sp. P47F7]|uniref:acyl-CoA carboxylase epsilon subunit n=1 Tax=Sinomonas sp. P47F7 TaxID=3410987 RepID=UPI003BF60B30
MSAELPGARESTAAHDGGDAPAVDREPLVRITKGNPTPEELAALTAVLAAVGTEEPEGAPVAPPTRRERIRRATLRPRPAMGQRRGRY